jgi:hypothetical protein
MAAKKQQGKQLKSKRNVAGFMSGGTFHPIRNSEDYDEARTGEPSKAEQVVRAGKRRDARRAAASQSQRINPATLAPYRQKLTELKQTGKQKVFREVQQIAERIGLSQSRAEKDARSALAAGRKVASRANGLFSVNFPIIGASLNLPALHVGLEKMLPDRPLLSSRKNPSQRTETITPGKAVRRNPLTPDAAHQVEVSRYYRGGGKSARQRAIEAGQMDFWGDNTQRSNGKMATKENGFFSSAKEILTTRKFKIFAEKVDSCKCRTVQLGVVRSTDSDSAVDEIKRRLKAKGDLQKYKNFQVSGRRVSTNPTKAQPPKAINRVSKMFQGELTGTVKGLPASRHINPTKLARIGKLSFLKLKGHAQPIRFNPETSMAAMDEKRKLYLVGSGVSFEKPDVLPGGDHLADYGAVEVIAYVTRKPHIGGDEVFEWVHHFGEEGGALPHLHVDADGMPLLHGGDYTITADGIVN